MAEVLERKLVDNVVRETDQIENIGVTDFKSFLEACLADKKFAQLDSVKDMLSDIENTHYFIIPEVYGGASDDYSSFIEKNVDHLNVDGIKIPEALDMPFQRCFFQCFNNGLTVCNSITYEEIAELMGFNKKEFDLYLQEHLNVSAEDSISAIDILIPNIYVHEIAPKYIRVIAVVNLGKLTFPISFSFKDGKIGVGKSDFNRLYEEMVVEVALSVISIFNILNHKSWTVVSNEAPVKVKTRVGRKLTKYKYKPSSIVYVSTKQKFCTRHPEHSHRIINKPNYAYEVRGHWRRLQYHQIGKDREGLRGIKGFTWVTSFTKGEGEVMKKVRIVK